MDETSNQRTPSDQEEHPTPPGVDRQPWQEPKLAFVEPKLIAHGDLKQVTGQGLFGGFTP